MTGGSDAGDSVASPRQLTLLSAAAFASMTSMRICDPLLPALARDFVTTTGHAAQVISAFAIAYGLLQLFYGPLADRYGKFRVVSLAVLGCALANLAAAFAPSLAVLVVCRAATGATAAAVIPLTMAWIGDAVPYDRRQEVLARLLGATVVGMIIGQWAGGFFADTLGWRSVFVALALLFAVVGVLMRVDLRGSGSTAPETPRPRGGGGESPDTYLARIRAVVAVPWAWRILGLAFVEGAFAYSAFAFVPTALHQRFGLAMTWAGAVLALYGVGGFFYSRLAPAMLRRWGETGLVRGGGLLLGITFTTLALMPHWAWSLPACFIGGLGFYMLHNTLQTHATQMAPRVRGTAVSLYACTLFLGQSVGIVAAAWVVDHDSVSRVFGGAAVMLPLLAWWFAARLRDRTPAAPVVT
ncbi:MAG TPA: MFS transporter [Casimicrobiaceae bacterium]|nr:MFS transporter [Casimicrobiaceae bacterium]